MRDSKLNPFNWFGHSQEAPAVPQETASGIANDPRQLVAQVTTLDVAETAGGAIVRANGLPPTQGWWKAELVAENHGEPVDKVDADALIDRIDAIDLDALGAPR